MATPIFQRYQVLTVNMGTVEPFYIGSNWNSGADRIVDTAPGPYMY